MKDIVNVNNELILLIYWYIFIQTKYLSFLSNKYNIIVLSQYIYKLNIMKYINSKWLITNSYDTKTVLPNTGSTSDKNSQFYQV